MFQPRIRFLVAITVYTIAMRLVPYVLSRFFGMTMEPGVTLYPWNFSPLMAIGLFGAAKYSNRLWSFAVPLGAWFASDLGIWALTGQMGFAFYPGQVFVYGGFALAISLGFLLRKNHGVLAIGATALLAQTVFFLISNFGAWMLYPDMYSHDFGGLMACYVAALPFFGRSLAGTAVFTAVLFSPLAVTKQSEAAVPKATIPEAVVPAVE